MKKTVHKFLPAESVALADRRQVRTIISAGGVDRQGDVVVQSGIDTSSFIRAGGTVLWQHDPDRPIAKAISIGIENTKLTALAQFPPAGVSAKADEVYGLILAGVVNATSIGFAPLKWEPIEPKDPFGGRRYLEIELMEFSFVSVPAMPDATVLERSHRRRKSGDPLSQADHARAIEDHLDEATKSFHKAEKSHARTRDLLDQMGGLIAEGAAHADAMLRTGLKPDATDPDADNELSATIEGRKRTLDALDRADRGAGRVPETRGGAWLAQRVRQDEEARLRGLWSGIA